jgi:hypothetical protein
VAIATLGAPQRWLVLRRRNRPKPAGQEPDPAPVLTTRATVIGVTPFDSDRAGRSWLRGADIDDEANIGVQILNDVLYAHRTTTADPFVREVSRDQALVVRVGIGEGEQVADGRWTEAREVEPAPPRMRRSAAMRPQERLAALLGGRDAALASEELTLRARLDLDRGRQREAALQLRVALEAALAELVPWVEHPGMAERLSGLKDERAAVGAAANMALQGGLDEATAADVARALRKVEGALRARSAGALD